MTIIKKLVGLLFDKEPTLEDIIMTELGHDKLDKDFTSVCMTGNSTFNADDEDIII